MTINTEFARLFKKYRLRSEIETLRQFADLMAAEGVVYDTTIYTRWQKGERVPRDRKVIIKMLEVFLKRGGINRIEECNKLLESINSRDLSDAEIGKAKVHLSNKSNRLVANIENYIERQQILKEACWALLNKRKVLLYGIPGVGKTSLAIYISHFLADSFTDGIHWFNAEQKSLDVLLDEVLNILHKGYLCNISLSDKLNLLNQVTKNNSILVVIDNIDLNRVDYKHLNTLDGSIIFTSVSLLKNDRTLSIKVPIFSTSEYRQLAVSILGKPYFEAYTDKIMEVGNSLGLLPITTHIYLQQIASDAKNLTTFMDQIEEQNIDYGKLRYDKKNLEQSFEVIIKQLSKDTYNTLCACSVFMGDDFNLSHIQSITYMSDSTVLESISCLRQYSLVEKATYTRYRIHPALRDYLIRKNTNFISLADELLKHYENKIQTIVDESILNNYINSEYSNIESLRSYYYRNKYYSKSLRCWNMLRNYLFTSGKWNNLLYISKQIAKAYKSTKDMTGLAYLYIEDLGKIYYFLDQSSKKAILCANKGINIAQQIHDDRLVSLAEQKLAILLIEKSELEKAEELLLQSNKYFQKEKIYYDLMFGHIYLGHIYKKKRAYSKSIKYFQYIIDNKHTPKEILALAYTCLSTVLVLMGNLPLAKVGLKQALHLCTQLNLKLTKALTYVCIGKVNLLQNNTTQAYINFERGNKIFSKLNVKPRPNSIWVDLIRVD